MPIVGSAWSTELLGTLSANGFVGSELNNFTDAIGSGSAGHVVGQTFTTTDVGTVPGAGVGVGVGIIGVDAIYISNQIYSYSVASFGQAGSKLKDVCDALGSACSNQMALATLASTHNPVFAGTGIVDIGSISVVGSDWGSLIQSFGSGSGFIGGSWPDWAEAIGKGQAEGVIQDGTGNVVITGAPSGIPVPGAGTGTGVIS